MTRLAQYRCLACAHEWLQEAARVVSAHFGNVMGWTFAAACPRCGGLHVLWLNYESEFAR